MTEDQTMRLVYLAILGGVIGGYFFLANRHRMGAVVQQGAIWFLIFVGAVLVYGVWDDVRRSALPSQVVMTEGGQTFVELPRSQDGHYHIVLEVNGTPIRFVVDTGATDLVLNQPDAARVGLDLDDLRFFGRAFTANGEVRTADVTLESVALGEHVDRDVRAVVNEGVMTQSLLGMSYLQEFGRIEIENDRLRLTR